MTADNQNPDNGAEAAEETASETTVSTIEPSGEQEPLLKVEGLTNFLLI
jgi:hypothetical protein